MISDERWKAVALASIARAISAGDPVRAARLTTDAVRVAQSVSDEVRKALALALIAQSVAATDPDRAEDIAQSITYDFAALVLARTARAMSADPARAARLTTDADRAGQSITNEYSKAMTLARIAEAVAATDPARTS